MFQFSQIILRQSYIEHAYTGYVQIIGGFCKTSDSV